MNSRKQQLKYLFFDIGAVIITWTVFFVFRKIIIESEKFGSVNLQLDTNYFFGLVVFPIFWVFMHWLSGYYSDIYRKSRLIELWNTFFISIIGVLILFFIFLLDDEINTFQDYYLSILVLFILQFFTTYTPRLFITTITKKKLLSRQIGFPTILITGIDDDEEFYEKLNNGSKLKINKIVGFISLTKNNQLASSYLKYLGTVHELEKIIKENKVEEIIISAKTLQHKVVSELIARLRCLNVYIKVISSDYERVLGIAKASVYHDFPFVEISNNVMSASQRNLKRVIDVVFSITAMIILIPVYIIIPILIVLDSKGPVVFKQKRVGRNGKQFTIYKFRTMKVDAEKDIPLLSNDNDDRVTRIGKTLRAKRIDEILQFYNVIKGDMSLVGPRPERQYFIDKITRSNAEYNKLLKVRPGITSLGQVKYGYASTVKQIIQRMKFDLFYIDNMSIYLDFKILIYTVQFLFFEKASKS